MVTVFTQPPDASRCYVRAESIVALSGPFKWSADVLARTVQLTQGKDVIVEDTDANVSAAVVAMGTADDAVQAVTDGKEIRGELLLIQDQQVHEQALGVNA